MKAWTILGYSGDADIYCVDCAMQKWEISEDEDVDSEGNEIHPIFASDDHIEEMICSACGCSLLDS
jgi:hypothetical protein